MQAARGIRLSPLRLLITGWPWLVLALVLLGIRLSKGAGFSDLYALASRPFWPGSAQSEWLRSAQQLDQQSRLTQLEADNRRLRELLALQQDGGGAAIAAPVIARPAAGWWQQLMLGKGTWQGVHGGDAVVAPGGLLGRVASVTPSTARVQLLTDPGSKVGVWVARTGEHGLLMGAGTARPILRLLDQDARLRPGDLVTTSPASTLVPPNLTVGVVQRVDRKASPPEAVIQLSAPIAAVDWVQLRPSATGGAP